MPTFNTTELETIIGITEKEIFYANYILKWGISKRMASSLSSWAMSNGSSPKLKQS